MGNGSSGPSSLEKPPEAAPKVSSLELALTWASDQRLRLQLLVSCSGAAAGLDSVAVFTAVNIEKLPGFLVW